jgi:hypothetical protein
MKKILALTAAAALAVTSIGCTKHEPSSEPAPPAGGGSPPTPPVGDLPSGRRGPVSPVAAVHKAPLRMSFPRP